MIIKKLSDSCKCLNIKAQILKYNRIFHLEDLGNIDAIAKEEVEMTIHQKSTIDQEGMKKVDTA